MPTVINASENEPKKGIEREERLRQLVHDLMTPLVAVRGYARMLLDGRTGEISDTQREYLTVIAENTAREIQLLTELRRTLNEPLPRSGENA